MASSVALRQKPGRALPPARLVSRTRSGSALEGPAAQRHATKKFYSQLSDVVIGAAPSLNRSISTMRQQRSGGGLKSSSPRFNSAMAKTLGLEEISSSRRRKWRTKTTKSLSKLGDAANAGDIKQTTKIVRKDGLTPLKRFKKAARLVKLLVTVSNVCRDLLVYAIKDEQWYEFCEKFLKDASEGGTPIDKNTFLTTVKNPVTKKFEQLEFDAAQFKHDYHSGKSLLTKEIKAILTKRPGSRTQREVEDTILCIKRLVPAFRAYTYEQQKQICQLVMYDRYFQERVILREDLPPDGIYFVLNGTLMESGKKMPAPRIIKPGDKFGEEDLISGMTRQSNVVTKSSVDLLYLHKFDYEEIFELSVDLAGDESKVFDICKQEHLFNYYPVAELVKNPGRWQVLKFKYGRLIASNSCETEFIYIIRSGEARVLKYLRTRHINVAQRRRRLQDEIDSADPYVYKKKLLDFVSDNKFQSSRYSLNAFSTKNLAADSKPIAERVRCISTIPDPKQGSACQKVQRSKTALATFDSSGPAIDSEKQVDKAGADNSTASGSQKLPNLKSRAQTARQLQSGKSPRPSIAQRPHTTKPSRQSKDEEVDIYRVRKAAVNKKVPSYVQVESLHAGHTYGMRSLLSADIQGEPAALVSAGCEVIQINRKFFAKYLDDNMINIIALKAKVYPSEDELLKRLDVNLQWEEYCAIVMCGYLDTKVASFRGGHVVPPQ